MIFITSGEVATDIDILACVVAYKELLKLRNIESEIVLRGKPTLSIPKKFLDLKFPSELPANYDESTDKFVIVDLSVIKYMSTFVKPDKIIEIFDHRFGVGEDWRNLPNAKTTIERVGSCATLIYEEFVKSGLENKISEASAELICYAIISNTLNLQSKNTSERDIDAFNKLKPIADFTDEKIAEYYCDVDTTFAKDPIAMIKTDAKTYEILGFKFIFLQAELWDAKARLDYCKDLICMYMKDQPIKEWVLTCPSIKEGKNYLLTNQDSKLIPILGQIIKANFNGNYGETSEIYLRKEIMELFSQITSV